MQHATLTTGTGIAVLFTFGLVLLAAGLPAGAASNSSVTTADQAAAQGLDLFNHEQFGGARTCSSCHSNNGTTRGHLPNGSAIPSLVGAAAHFPKYNARAGQVITLPQRVSMCIAGGLQGNPPSLDSPQITDLTAYLTKLSQGQAMGQQFKTAAPDTAR